MKHLAYNEQKQKLVLVYYYTLVNYVYWCAMPLIFVCALLLLIKLFSRFLSELILLSSFGSVEHCIMYCCNLRSALSQRQGAIEMPK